MKLEFSEYVERARGGDADAFAELYSLVYKDMYYIALCNLGNSHDSADAVSEAVLDAYLSIGKLRDISAFKSWMFKILTFKIKKKQAEYVNIKQNTTEMPEENGENIPSTEDVYYILEIYEHFNLLSETERLVFSLTIISGYSSDEISRLTGIKSSTVRTHLLRGREKLKKVLAQD